MRAPRAGRRKSGFPTPAVATPDVAVTPKTKPFAQAFEAKYGSRRRTFLF